MWRSSHFAGSLQSKHKQIQYKTVVLCDERCKLQAPNYAVTVCVIHVFIIYDDVILGCHVISNVVIDN